MATQDALTGNERFNPALLSFRFPG
jgi:hypothetical protein